MADVVLSSSPLAVLQARLNNVDKQTMEIEQKLKSIQLNPSGSGPSGGKELSKDDLSQIEAFARTLVEHRSEHDKIVKQMVDERAVKAISDEIVSKSNSPGDYYPRSPQYTSLFDSPGTPASYGSYSPGSYTGYMPQTPPYTAMSPMSPMSPMQVQYVPVVPQAQPAPAQPAPAASASSSSGGDNTKKIILS
jgi:hypothetical protein